MIIRIADKSTYFTSIANKIADIQSKLLLMYIMSHLF